MALMMDGTSSEAKPAALGYVCVPWFSTRTDGARDFGDPEARVITLKRRSKKRLVDVAVAFRWGGTIACDLRDYRERCRNSGYLQMSGEPLFERADFLLHGA